MSNNLRRITKVVLITALVLLTAYSIYVYYAGGPDATISWVMLGWSNMNPVIPFGIGFVSGHLFWPLREK